MIFAQFYQKSAIAPFGLIPVCGDRGVIILDGRKRVFFNTLLAMDECKRRGYLGVQLFSGHSFTDNKELTAILEPQ